MARFPVRGGSLENLSMRSLYMSRAFISLKPGLCVPTIFEANDEINRVASLALQKGHTVSSTLAWTDWVASNAFSHFPHRYS